MQTENQPLFDGIIDAVTLFDGVEGPRLKYYNATGPGYLGLCSALR